MWFERGLPMGIPRLRWRYGEQPDMKPTAYYNEIDGDCCNWLQNLMDRGLIMAGKIDDRSIEDVKPADLAGFTRVGFFSGIGGWELALQLAGWPDDRPVWHGSAPCQSFSQAGKGAGFDDQRHLWPAWFHLISQCRPEFIIGEQVSSKSALGWFDLVQADLENAHYASGGIDLCSAGIDGAHIRQRLYWMANPNGRDSSAERKQCGGKLGLYAQDDGASGLANEHGGAGIEGGTFARGCGEGGNEASRRGSGSSGEPDGQRMGNPGGEGLEGRSGAGSADQRIARPSSLDSALWLYCTDGKVRPISPKSCSFPLAAKLSRDMVRGEPELGRLARRASKNRSIRLKGYGNAIDVGVAAEFVKACM